MSTRPETPDILGDMLTGKAQTEKISLASIKTDGGTQMRADLNQATVEEYREAMQANGWHEFPPVITYYDGAQHWLADGFHRIAAYRLIAVATGDTLVPAIVKAGDRRAAILHAAGANAIHGLRRTNADKRRAVEVLLRDAEWSQWSDNEIARRCGVSQPFVSTVRKEMATTYNGYKSDGPPTTEIPQSNTRIGADGRVYNTANIGANRPGPSTQPAPVDSDYAAVWQLEVGVRKAVVPTWMKADARTRQTILAEMNQARMTKAGSFWMDVKNAMPDTIKAYRHQDLQQAIANVVEQLRQGMQREANAQNDNAQKTTPDEPASDYAPVWQLEVGVRKAIDRQWLAAPSKSVKWLILEQVERTRINKAGALWDEIKRDMPDTVKTYRHSDLQQAIANVAEQLKQGMQRETDPWASPGLGARINSGARQAPTTAQHAAVATPSAATAEPAVVAVVAEPAPEAIHEAAETQLRRMQLEGVQDELTDALETLNRFGNLTGKHTETLLAARELRKLLDILNAELDALKKEL